jgi:hypothetical protein
LLTPYALDRTAERLGVGSVRVRYFSVKNFRIIEWAGSCFGGACAECGAFAECRKVAAEQAADKVDCHPGEKAQG